MRWQTIDLNNGIFSAEGIVGSLSSTLIRGLGPVLHFQSTDRVELSHLMPTRAADLFAMGKLEVPGGQLCGEVTMSAGTEGMDVRPLCLYLRQFGPHRGALRRIIDFAANLNHTSLLETEELSSSAAALDDLIAMDSEPLLSSIPHGSTRVLHPLRQSFFHSPLATPEGLFVLRYRFDRFMQQFRLRTTAIQWLYDFFAITRTWTSSDRLASRPDWRTLIRGARHEIGLLCGQVDPREHLTGVTRDSIGMHVSVTAMQELTNLDPRAFRPYSMDMGDVDGVDIRMIEMTHAYCDSLDSFMSSPHADTWLDERFRQPNTVTDEPRLIFQQVWWLLMARAVMWYRSIEIHPHSALYPIVPTSVASSMRLIYIA
ncbi:hypothetical protein BDZ85DRAFT_7268 [Elsinoe ampelina]|uniref:Uncharacterized protein n=1 Tax=Elsinoe ampelina TaxID=302913 RepID=A0A6A6GPS6_9PEZI|nr:hypothetical protein BDZ85DRAFT_7268 [Elsinoe ampelina]